MVASCQLVPEEMLLLLGAKMKHFGARRGKRTREPENEWMKIMPSSGRWRARCAWTPYCSTPIRSRGRVEIEVGDGGGEEVSLCISRVEFGGSGSGCWFVDVGTVYVDCVRYVRCAKCDVDDRWVTMAPFTPVNDSQTNATIGVRTPCFICLRHFGILSGKQSWREV